MIRSITLFFFIILSLVGFTQELEESKKLKSVFVEAGGKGYGSLNFEYGITQKHNISAAVTILDYTWFDPNAEDSIRSATLPTPSISYSFLIGKTNHFFELGAGISILPYFREEFDRNDSAFSFHGAIGYRFQKDNGILLRAGLYPFYRINWVLLPLPGVSLGYTWK